MQVLSCFSFAFLPESTDLVPVPVYACLTSSSGVAIAQHVTMCIIYLVFWTYGEWLYVGGEETGERALHAGGAPSCFEIKSTLLTNIRLCTVLVLSAWSPVLSPSPPIQLPDLHNLAMCRYFYFIFLQAK